MESGEVDEFLRACDDGSSLGCPRNGDASAAPELEQSLVAEDAQGPEDGVCVDVEDGGEVFGRREAGKFNRDFDEVRCPCCRSG
jgi:hypothetical protein